MTPRRLLLLSILLPLAPLPVPWALSPLDAKPSPHRPWDPKVPGPVLFRETFMPTAADRLIIFDTTLRDGEQSPGASMNLAEKLEIAHALKDLGVDVIEAGFPIASIGD